MASHKIPSSSSSPIVSGGHATCSRGTYDRSTYFNSTKCSKSPTVMISGFLAKLHSQKLLAMAFPPHRTITSSCSNVQTSNKALRT